MSDGDRRTPVDGYEGWDSAEALQKLPEDLRELVIRSNELVRRYQDQRDKTLVILREDDKQRKETLAVLKDIKDGMAKGFPMPLWGKVNLFVTALLCLAVAFLFWLVLTRMPMLTMRAHAVSAVSSASAADPFAFEPVREVR